MTNIRFGPKIGKMFWIIWIPTSILMIAATIIAITSTLAFIILLLTDIFTFYFMVTSLVGYVELREHSIFIRFGFIMTTEIPYIKIRGIIKKRQFYADSMLSLKNSMEHVNIKYNRFDIVSISVTDNDLLISELYKRIANALKKTT